MMKISSSSRRMFLQGLGGTSLAIPFLPSLASRKAAAASAVSQGPTRFAAMIAPLGREWYAWWPKNLPVTPSADGSYRWRTLSDIPGEISPGLSAFNGPIRRKIAVLRGLDPVCRPTVHMTNFPLSASIFADPSNRTPNQPNAYAWTVDAILEQSPTFYATRPAIGAIRSNGVPKPYFNAAGAPATWCYAHKNGIIQPLPTEFSPKNLYDKVFNGAAAGGTVDPKVNARMTRLKDLASLVNEDYSRIATARKIGMEDKARLDNFMNLVSEVRKKLADRPVVSCSKNATVDAEVANGLMDFDKLNDAFISLEVLALACGVTKVVVHMFASGGPSLSDGNVENWHAAAHQGTPYRLAYTKYHMGKINKFLTKLDQIAEPDGNTLLDNTVFLYGNEDSKGSHRDFDMPCIIAGGKGKLKTDVMIDYQNYNDRVGKTIFGDWSADAFYYGAPWNNLLVTLMKALGLTEAPVSQGGFKMYPDRDGIGGYSGGHDPPARHYAKWDSTAGGKNAPLPGLLLG